MDVWLVECANAKLMKLSTPLAYSINLLSFDFQSLFSI